MNSWPDAGDRVLYRSFLTGAVSTGTVIARAEFRYVIVKLDLRNDWFEKYSADGCLRVHIDRIEHITPVEELALCRTFK